MISIGDSLNSLEPTADCGVGVGVMSSESITTYPWNGGRLFFVSSFKFVTTCFVCGGEFFSSSGLLVMWLANTRESNSLL